MSIVQPKLTSDVFYLKCFIDYHFDVFHSTKVNLPARSRLYWEGLNAPAMLVMLSFYQSIVVISSCVKTWHPAVSRFVFAMDSKVRLFTSTDVASQCSWTIWCKYDPFIHFIAPISWPFETPYSCYSWMELKLQNECFCCNCLHFASIQ